MNIFTENRSDMNNIKKVWHQGGDKPFIYVDKITNQQLTTFALCVVWYDVWVEDLCKVTEDHKFILMTNGNTYDSDFFWYWCYTYDLMPCENTTELINIGTVEQ